MKLFKTTAPVGLHSGLIGLVPEQALPRSNNLRPAGEEGLYEIVKPIQLKAGEIFAHDGEMPKGFPVEVLQDLDESPGDTETKAKRKQP